MGNYKQYLKVTVKELAETSGRCETTVRRHIRSGKLNPYDLWSVMLWVYAVGRGVPEDKED